MRRTIIALAVLLAAAAAPWAPAQTGASAKALQACAVRFGWMHYQHYFSQTNARARVEANPCEVDVLYSPSTPYAYFPCTLNSFGAYVCATHAQQPPTDPPLAPLNAVFHSATGAVTVTGAPRVTLPKPTWVLRYPVRQGMIVPYDAHGTLRPGLTVVSAGFSVFCDGQPEKATGMLNCAASTVCFVADRTVPAYNGEQALCPAEPGSRRMQQATIST